MCTDMNRAQLIELLADLAGPLGPFLEVHEREQARSAWLAELDAKMLEMLLDILIHPPDPIEYRPATWDQFEMELADAVSAAGKQNPHQLLESIGPLLDLATPREVRPTIISLIGALGLREGVQWLKPIVENQQLTVDENLRLACSLGEIGGADARALLERMKQSPNAANDEVRREIEIALEALSR